MTRFSVSERNERDDAERLARLETRLESVTYELEKLVSRAEFIPVKVITYGLSGGILTAFLSALIVKVMGQP